MEEDKKIKKICGRFLLQFKDKVVHAEPRWKDIMAGGGKVKQQGILTYTLYPGIDNLPLKEFEGCLLENADALGRV